MYLNFSIVFYPKLAFIDSDQILKQKQEILKTIPGIGDIVAFELLVMLQELGCLDRRKIA